MSLIVAPTQLARDAAIAMMANGTSGFNSTYATSLPNHPGAPAMSIDFTGAAKNFFKGDLDPESLEETSAFQYPLLTMFGIGGASRNLQKFQRFSGVVKVGGRFLLSGSIYKSARVLQNFEAWPDAIEDAFLQVIQVPSAAPWPATSAYSVLYNGEVSYERKFPLEGGTGWLQMFNFQLTLEVVVA